MASKAIIGKKVGMTQVWSEDGRVVPVTVLRVEPCRVVQLKTIDSDGYSALQVTWGYAASERLTSPERGHFEARGVEPGKALVELRLDDVSEYEVGQEIGVDILAEGEFVDVTAVSKGKGFTGVMKRHGFSGQGASHGTHKVHRKPGAVGQCATPSRIFKGRKMPGLHGGRKTTTLNLRVVTSDAERSLLMLKGSVPGPRGANVVIRDAVKASKARS